MRIVNTTNTETADELAERYMNAGRERLFSAKAARRKLKNSLNYAMTLEDLGDVDCSPLPPRSATLACLAWHPANRSGSSTSWALCWA